MCPFIAASSHERGQSGEKEDSERSPDHAGSPGTGAKRLTAYHAVRAYVNGRVATSTLAQVASGAGGRVQLLSIPEAGPQTPPQRHPRHAHRRHQTAVRSQGKPSCSQDQQDVERLAEGCKMHGTWRSIVPDMLVKLFEHPLSFEFVGRSAWKSITLTEVSISVSL
jgi:hypothetical protein